MKKALSLVLVLVLCCSFSSHLTACGNNSIELTKENFEQYFSLSEYIGGDNYFQTKNYATIDGDNRTDRFPEIVVANASIEAVSNNFNYENICVVFRFYGKIDISGIDRTWRALADPQETIDFEIDVEVKTNIAGQGEGSGRFLLPANRVANPYVVYNVEIVSISGTITPV